MNEKMINSETILFVKNLAKEIQGYIIIIIHKNTTKRHLICTENNTVINWLCKSYYLTFFLFNALLISAIYTIVI